MLRIEWEKFSVLKKTSVLIPRIFNSKFFSSKPIVFLLIFSLFLVEINIG